MDDIGFDSETVGDRGIDVVPRVRMIRGDVKVLAERLGDAEQLDEWRGEIRASRQRPDGCAVAGEDHRLSREHPTTDGVILVENRRQHRAHDVTRPHNGPGQPARALEQAFTGDLVLAVCPEGINRGRLFRDHIAPRRLLVDRGRRDKDELAGPAGESRNVVRHLLGREGDELADHVEACSPELAIGRVLEIAGDGGHAPRQIDGRLPAIEDGDAMAGRDRLGDAGQRNVSGAADEKDVQGHGFLPAADARWLGDPDAGLRRIVLARAGAKVAPSIKSKLRLFV
jgi:hypothetical protein